MSAQEEGDSWCIVQRWKGPDPGYHDGYWETITGPMTREDSRGAMSRQRIGSSQKFRVVECWVVQG